VRASGQEDFVTRKEQLKQDEKVQAKQVRYALDTDSATGAITPYTPNFELARLDKF